MELLRDTLDVVEAIDTDNEFDSVELARKSINALLNLGFLEALDELLRINTDGECANGDEFAIVINTIRGRRSSTTCDVSLCSRENKLSLFECVLQNARATAQEVTSVVVGMESDEIAVEDARQEGFANGKDTVNFGRRERRVQEEANLDVLLGVADFLAKHLRQQHQMVVVNPDQIAILNVLDDSLGKQAVDFAVSGPCALVKCDFTGVVVEKRPENRVCEKGLVVSRARKYRGKGGSSILEKPL